MPTSVESAADRRRREEAIRLIRAGEPVSRVARKVRRHRVTIWRWTREYEAARAIGGHS